MGKFDGILICTDLDGTLLKNDKTVSRENKEAIEYFKGEGGYFTFITGRMPHYSYEAYNAASPNVPIGCVNGGGLYDMAAGKYVWKLPISRDVLELVRCIDEKFATIGIQVCSFNKTYFSKENEVMRVFRGLTGLPNLVCGYNEVPEPFAKILFGTDSEEEMAALEKTLKEHPRAGEFEFIRSERTLFEILPKGSNKSLAFLKLVDYLKVNPQRTVAVGDYYNDVKMLEAAGVGVAVSNACRAALDACDYVTVSNEENALAQVIYDLERGKFGI
jgi:Cof subfamily protein (haloacid dehalogenase superfamily)